MMLFLRIIRRTYRIIALTFWFTVMFMVALFCCFGDYRAVKRITKITHFWAKGIARIISLKIIVNGEIPKDFTNKLIIANHSSYLDIIVHAALFPIRFTPKAEIRRWPILGLYIESSRPIWVNRTSRQKAKELIKEFAKTIQHGIPLIVYPEGTTSNNRSSLLKFKTTSFEVAKQCKASLLPIVCLFRDTVDNKPLAWYGDMTLLPHLWRILGYKKMTVEVKILNDITIEKEKNRKQIAEEAYQILNINFLEVLNEYQEQKQEKGK
ncbi:lysophospholipid acyltransferase family protein [Lentisphaerota bacterium WC36G]|nr:1-acyl-sn-glycerol-3-phosphate acyltransferase [Lentisphaerae bacterium WC36]